MNRLSSENLRSIFTHVVRHLILELALTSLGIPGPEALLLVVLVEAVISRLRQSAR